MAGLEPHGEVVDLGGRTVQVRTRAGEGRPIVLIAGCGLAMQFWRDVADSFDGREWLVSYDRPGIGGTPWPGTLPTLTEEQATLVALLERLGSPAVLVGHSMASFIVEAVARTRPELVAGVVMVDGSVEWPVRPPREGTARLAGLVGSATGSAPLGAVGSLAWHLGTWVQSTREFRNLHGGRLSQTYADPDTLAAATAESFAYDWQAWDLIELRRRAAWPDGLPTIVLTAAHEDSHLRRWTRRWVRTQARWARLLGARHQVVTSRHLMMLDRPQVIVDAVRELCVGSSG
ncbi:alpha/beta fold hydrolase [Aestuariimicrobium sp. T2.26MG-19.2B]|uniref:alpha/beta fold hydrolase n=1 Tax=Aestuariimicrobium sp. T2.26MG-19.2B TaxID=3040679 RepID=UPI002477AB85|nr:alpha/beta hydrolase [Aestuariimicrobium sp. T2.26MG-19.2B]CAI9407833.1 Putative aminoacrylate hydrolase RutD [Aestuariimicrobium sp. T2.26MG-19.2B]